MKGYQQLVHNGAKLMLTILYAPMTLIFELVWIVLTSNQEEFFIFPFCHGYL